MKRTTSDHNASDDDGTTTDDNEPTKQNVHRTLAACGRRRGRVLAEWKLTAPSHMSTFLESVAIRKPTEISYRKEVCRFIRFCDQENVRLTGDAEVDGALVRHLHGLFLAGYGRDKPERLMAGLLHFAPEWGRFGYRHTPRAWRALKGYRLKAPGRSRKAYSLGLWAALAWDLARRGHWLMAVKVMVDLSAYLRPNDGFSMQRRDLVPPVAGVTQCWSLLLYPEERLARSKVGAFDDSIMMDSTYTPWLPDILKEMAVGPPLECPWPFDYTSFSKEFKVSASRIGMNNLVPYQLRHSGASIDSARRLRSLAEIKKRGRWSSDQSVKRYERGAKLGANMMELSRALRDMCDKCERQLEDLFLGRVQASVVATLSRNMGGTSGTSSQARVE